MREIWTRLLPERWHTLAPALEGAVSLLLLLLGLGLLHLLARKAIRRAIASDRVDRTVGAFVETIVRYALVVIAVVAILGELGVNTASLLGSVGILGLTIGFAARDALSNVISGLFILWDRPFVIGDLIEIDGAYGRVDRITMRSTRVVTLDGKMLAIPNTTVVNTTVASYTNFPHLRLDVDVTVGVEEDLGRVRRTLLDLCRAEDYLETPPPTVVVTELGDYYVKLQLQVWIDDETRHVPLRFALRECAFESLRAAGIHMPYETIELAPVQLRDERRTAEKTE